MRQGRGILTRFRRLGSDRKRALLRVFHGPRARGLLGPERSLRLGRQLIHRWPPRFPRTINIGITGACNLRCVTCEYAARGDERKTDRMPLDLFRRIIDSIRQRVQFVSLTPDGEPLLHGELPQMVRYASQAGCTVILTSNGLLFTREKLAALFDAGLDWLRISADGATAETYEKIRLGASFEELLRGLELLRRARAAHRWQGGVEIHTVLTVDNIHELEPFRRVFAPFADRLTASYPSTFGEKDSGLSPVPLGPPVACLQLVSLANIMPNGDISICCCNPRRRTILGNAATDDILAVWRGESYQRLRELHRRHRFDAIDMCRGCRIAEPSTRLEMSQRWAAGAIM